MNHCSSCFVDYHLLIWYNGWMDTHIHVQICTWIAVLYIITQRHVTYITSLLCRRQVSRKSYNIPLDLYNKHIYTVYVNLFGTSIYILTFFLHLRGFDRLFESIIKKCFKFNILLSPPSPLLSHPLYTLTKRQYPWGDRIDDRVSFVTIFDTARRSCLRMWYNSPIAWYWTIMLSDDRASCTSFTHRLTMSPLPLRQRCYKPERKGERNEKEREKTWSFLKLTRASPTREETSAALDTAGLRSTIACFI